MNSNTKLLLASSMLALVACGSGSGDSSSSASPPPPPNVSSGGLWFGTLTFDQNQMIEEFVALTTDDGRFRLISLDSMVQMAGSAPVDGTALSGSGRAYADAGTTWLDNSIAVDMEIEAVISERSSLSGAWSTSSSESGTFEFVYDSLYERPITLALIEGMWTSFDELSNPAVTFTIDNSGSFSGQNAQGCNSLGKFSIIDARYNLFGVQNTITDCAIAGDYSGLALIGDLFAPNDVMVLSLDSGEQAILLGFERQ